jgi:hypothetical protein
MPYQGSGMMGFKKSEKFEKMVWLQGIDIESGLRRSVQVPRCFLYGIPSVEPYRTDFIEKLHTLALDYEGLSRG